MAMLTTGPNSVGATTSTLTTEPFVVTAGLDTISFAFNFLTNEATTGTNVFDDTANAIISGALTKQTFLLASVNSSTFVDADPTTGFNMQTGFENIQLDASAFVGIADVTLEFQVFDVGDTVVDSAILIDNLVLE